MSRVRERGKLRGTYANLPKACPRLCRGGVLEKGKWLVHAFGLASGTFEVCDDKKPLPASSVEANMFFWSRGPAARSTVCMKALDSGEEEEEEAVHTEPAFGYVKQVYCLSWQEGAIMTDKYSFKMACSSC